MEEHGTLRAVVGGGRAVAESARGLPQRLRSAFRGRPWSRGPEPRVRFGQPVLPGLAALGPESAPAASALLARAAAFADGRCTHLGATRAIDGRVDWSARGASPAWRAALHGLDELFALGVAATLAADADGRRGRVELALRHVQDWAARGRGVAAAGTPSAHARRVVRLVEATAFFAPELRAGAAARRALLDVLWTEAESLAAALPRQAPDAALVASARALLVAGRYFDGMEARGWVEQGQEALWAQLREQVHDDGGHRAHDPAVHAVVLGEYLEAMALLRAGNDDVPPWARKRVKSMADFLARMVHPDGVLALGAGIAQVEPHPVPELLAVAAVLLHEPAFAAPGELPGVWPLLILGESGRRAFAALPRRPLVPVARALRRTGYFVLPGAAGDVMLVDGAPGFAHELSLGGERVLVGPGVGVDATHPLAPHLRDATARNVLGGAVPAGAAETHWAMRDGLLSFVGTVPLTADRRHRRVIVALPGRFWLVCDEVTGGGSFEGESLVHLHPATVVRARCDGRTVLRASRSGARVLALAFAGSGAVHLTTGVEAPAPLGWHADAPGDVRPAPVASVAVRGTLPLVTGYALAPDVDGPLALALRHDGFELHARLRVGADDYELTLVQDEVELVTRR